MAKEDKVDRARQVKELALSRRIFNVLSRKVDEMQGAAKEDFRLEKIERQRLLEINNLGLAEGVAAGLLSLVVLRRMRGSLLRRIYANQQKQQSAAQGPHQSPFVPPTGGSTNPFAPPAPPPPTAGSSSRSTPRQGPVMFFMGWLLDGVASLSIAATVSFAYTNAPAILGQLSALPLVEGRSTVARHFCPDVVKELQAIRHAAPAAVDDDNDDVDLVNHPQTKQLQAVIQFAENCQRRQAYEEELRQNQGVAPRDPVDVPPPGVPADYPLSSGGDYPAGPPSDDRHHPNGDDNNDEDDGFAFYDPRVEQDASAAGDWAEDFVTDQEERDNPRTP
jgi:hypothetical protein